MEKHKTILNKTHKNNKRKLETNEEDGEEEVSTEQVTCEENHIYFYADVAPKTILKLNQAIDELNEPGKMYPEIFIHINSYYFLFIIWKQKVL